MSISKHIKAPTTLTATYKIITPMFIGDAEQKASWISPMSFKGALRFWWRALAWGRIRSKPEYHSDELALKQLHHEEAELFGDTDKGRGKIAIKIAQPKIKTLTDWPPNSANNPSSYLAYGITASGSVEKNNYEPHRQAIQENVDFDIELITANDISEQQIQHIETALKALGLFGGLGSRSRRANGCTQLTKLNNQDYLITNYEDYQQKVGTILQKFSNTTLSPYSAFSKDSLFKVNKFELPDARKAHAELGTIYKDFRGQPSDLRGARKKVFGLPLTQVDEKARRSSPLFFHIVQFSDNQYGFGVLYLPTSVFHKEQRHNAVEWNLTKGFVETIGD